MEFGDGLDTPTALEFALRLFHFRSLFNLVGGNVGDQPLLKGEFLYFTRTSTNVHDEAVDFKLPHQGIVVHTAGQSPVVIELADLQHLANQLGLALPGTFTNAERFVDGGEFHVRGLAAVVEEINPANRTYYATGPCVRFAADQW